MEEEEDTPTYRSSPSYKSALRGTGTALGDPVMAIHAALDPVPSVKGMGSNLRVAQSYQSSLGKMPQAAPMATAAVPASGLAKRSSWSREEEDKLVEALKAAQAANEPQLKEEGEQMEEEAAEQVDDCEELAQSRAEGLPSVYALMDGLRDPDSGWNVVHYLAALGASSELAAVLSTPHCPAASLDPAGRSPLLLALLRGKGAAARLLLRAQRARALPWAAVWKTLGGRAADDRDVEVLASSLAATDVRRS